MNVLRAIVLLVAFAAVGIGCGDDGARPQSDGNAEARPAPNLIIIVIDSLRRDAVALPGQEPAHMPFLASMAADGVAFESAAAPAPWTVPSITSMLTGLLPREHGCDSTKGVPHLPAGVTTFAELLRDEHGYETAVFTGAPWFVESDHSILQGFERGSVNEGFGLQGTRPAIERWQSERDPHKPFFLYLHTFEAHDPYGRANHRVPDSHAAWTPEELRAYAETFDPAAITTPRDMTRVYLLDRPGRELMTAHHGAYFQNEVVGYASTGFAAKPDAALADELRTAYLAGVRWVDSVLERAVDELRTAGLLENTLLVVTADHGETFGEHGMLGHGRQLFDELVHIPLVMTGPAPFDRPALVNECVGLIDVLPTFMGWAGLTSQPGTRGRSFLPVLRNEASGRPVISQERLTRNNAGPGHRAILASVRSERWKFVIQYDRAAGRVHETVFDLAADPGERRPLGPSDAAWNDAMCEEVERVRDRIWADVAAARALHGSVYAPDDPPVVSTRPATCRSSHR